MPSAATAKLEKQASTEAPEPMRQAIVMIEHKIRNLEKRKRKIEIYQEEQKNGKSLNADQLNAVSKFDEVLQTLEFARDFSKQLNILANESGKQLKKQARKEAQEKAQQEVARVKEILIVQDVLQNMGQDNVRQDFLEGRNGAAQLTEEELKFLDDLYGEVVPKHGSEEGLPPFQEQLQLSAEHLLAIVDGKTKDIVGTTYAKLKELVNTISTCGYFDQVEVTETVAEEVPEYETESQEVPEEYINKEEEPVSEPYQAAPAVPPQLVSIPAQAIPVPVPVADVESSLFAAAAAASYVPAQQQAHPLTEFINAPGSGNIDFLQESEVEQTDLSAMLSTAQQPRAVPAASPVPVAPIPSQTYTNQNFVAGSAPKVPQQVVYQAQAEIPQPHIPGFATSTPNLPPPIPIPPSHLHTQLKSIPVTVLPQNYSGQSVNQVSTYASQAQQASYAQSHRQQHHHLSTGYETEKSEHVEAPKEVEQLTTAQNASDEWSQNETNEGDWNQQTDTQGDWNQAEDSGNEWISTSNNQSDGFTTQGGSRNYGGRGRSNRNNRGSSNGYSGGRGGPRNNYQNGRGGGSGGNYGGYRNSDSNNMYPQNGYQQRDNFSGGNSYGGGFKRGSGGPRRGGGGGPREGGNASRGGSGGRGGNSRGRGGGSGGYRGGNKQ